MRPIYLWLLAGVVPPHIVQLLFRQPALSLATLLFNTSLHFSETTLLPKHPALHKYLSHPSLRLAVCLMALLLGFAATPAKAQPANASDHDRARAAARAGQILPLPKVLASIRPNYPGEVLDVDLEQSGERWLYEIKLLQDGGQLRKLIVDASTGTVLLDRVPLGRRWRRKLQADEAAPPALGQHQHRRGACGPSGCPAPAAAAAPSSPPPQAPKP